MSTSVVLNRVLGWVDDVIGGSALLWRHQHNVAHHSHPNDKDLDPDTYSNYPMTRFNPEFKRLWFHQWQWLYAPALLYPFIGMSYSLGDFASLARAAYTHVPLHGLRTVDWVLFLTGKAAHYGLLLGVPVALWGAQGLWLCFLPLELVGGFFLASVFAVSHNVPEILYNAPRTTVAPTATHSLPRDPDAEKQAAASIAAETSAAPRKQARKQPRRRSTSTPGGAPAAAAAAAAGNPVSGQSAAPPPMDWAEMQIRASANWSVGSSFWLLASGGLNYQIEHHLFPGVAHIHYPAISKIVSEECASRGIPYLSFPSFRAIFAAHLRHLYLLGQA